MSLYRVDFFDRSLNNVHHDVVDNLNIDEDYLAPEASDIYIQWTDAVNASDFVYISGAFNFLGVVTSVTDDNYRTKVSVKPFISLFDSNILFDTDLQSKSTSTLEGVLADTIRKYWMNSGDDSVSISVLQLNTFTSTPNWGMNLKSDTEGTHYCIINFYSVLISRALTKYGISITPEIDFSSKKIKLNIGAISEVKKIQADREGVGIKSFDINRNSQIINKLIVHNAENYAESRIYYLHNDGSYDRINTDRVLPVVFDVKVAIPGGDVTFASAADDEASSTFNNVDWDSLIELYVELSDLLIDPLNFRIGTPAIVYHYGQPYNTILTCKSYSRADVILSFGAVRTTLTKKQILINNKFK